MTQLAHKNIEPIAVIAVTVTAKMSTLIDDIGQVPDEMMKECQQHGIEVLGPFIFEYTGVDCSTDAPFKLEMALPVKQGLDYQGKYEYKTLPTFKCVEFNFTGAISEIENRGYKPMMEAMQEQNLPILDTCREVYTKWIGPDSDDNIIELQMAI